MTTLATLNTLLAGSIRDTSYKTFATDAVDEMVNMGLAAVGRVAPERFQEDITVVADTLSYIVRSSVFAAGHPDIELVRVEVWDTNTTPDTCIGRLAPKSGEYSTDSRAGWALWNGRLELPNSVEQNLVVGDNLIRVWGYSPYAKMTGAVGATLTTEQEYAVIEAGRVEALRRLNADRDLFTQWQTKSGNSDVSPAALMNMLSLAETSWRQLSRAIYVPREAP